MNPTDTSIDQVILIGLIAGALMALFAWRSRGMVGRILLGLLALGMLVPSGILFVGRNPWLVDARYRKFRMLYWNIRAGMTAEQVNGEIRSLYPPDPDQPPPALSSVSATQMQIQMPAGAMDRSPEESISETIVLEMQGGQVVRKESVER